MNTCYYTKKINSLGLYSFFIFLFFFQSSKWVSHMFTKNEIRDEQILEVLVTSHFLRRGLHILFIGWIISPEWKVQIIQQTYIHLYIIYTIRKLHMFPMFPLFPVFQRLPRGFMRCVNTHSLRRFGAPTKSRNYSSSMPPFSRNCGFVRSVNPKF